MVNDKRGVNVFDPPPGMLRSGSITGSNGDILSVQLTETPAIRGKIPSVSVPRVFPLADSSGMFIGSYPAKGTTVTVGQSLGGQYHIVNYEPINDNLIPDLSPGELLIQSTDTSKILFDLDSNINIGSDISNIHVFAGSQRYPSRNLITMTFQNENHFTQGYREVGGLIKRDLHPNPQAASYSGNTKLTDDTYDSVLQVIGLDPTATANDLRTGPNKNPPLVEHREMVYEFQYDSSIDDDTTESNKYTTTQQLGITYTTPNRRTSRADTLSLSLVSPNYLIEEVKGTVVDIFGNILDINRMPLPVGLSATTTLRSSGTVATTNAQQSYINIRALERKSIAYHFEVNARKDPTPTNQGSNLSINDDNPNAKMQRSRFFFDVDKEGQFKLNVPASSETGNVPLLVRPENYSSFGTTDSSNPNQLWFLKSGQPISQDIFVDSFAAPQVSASSSEAGFSSTFAHGSITLKNAATSADAGPPDRISQFVDNSPYNIKHGTAFHDILQTCNFSRTSSMLGYPTGAVDNPDVSYIASDPATTAAPVNSTITVAGTGANAGGRSGQLNFDGSLEMNIGANTVDRQSLWLDTAGGVVGNVGRDKNQRSMMLGMNGHCFIQIGGPGLYPAGSTGDARFTPLGQDVPIAGILDIRVFVGGQTHLIRVDQMGMLLMSPGRIGIHAGQGMTLTSDGDIEIDCEQLTMQQRAHKKVFGGSS
jgi:hypothetical protein